MRGKLQPVTVSLLAVMMVVAVVTSSCETQPRSQRIDISVQTVNVDGRHVRIEYYEGGELVNSVNLIDGDGDGVIDGKSGPSEKGAWPKGWEWFDDLYHDVAVGYSTIEVANDRITITEGNTYEFLTGEYECERVE